MKPLHEFAAKKEATLSLVWLDENFQQALDLDAAQAARFDAREQVIASLTAEILVLKDAIRKVGSIDAIAERVLAKLREAP